MSGVKPFQPKAVEENRLRYHPELPEQPISADSFDTVSILIRGKDGIKSHRPGHFFPAPFPLFALQFPFSNLTDA